MPVDTGPKGKTKKLQTGMGLYGVQHLPSKAPDKSKPWAVVNLETGDVNGRWHPNEASAKDQQKALYAQLGKKARYGMSEVECYVTPIAFAEIPGETVWLEVLPARVHHTMQYGEVAITEDKLQNMIKNFKAGVRGQDVATDFNHGMDPAKGTKASGWYKDLDVRNGSLWAEVKLTNEAKKELEDNQWKYFSAEWEDTYVDHNGKTHKDVLVGGGFTNRPVAKNMVPINFSELYEEKKVVNEHSSDEHREPGEDADYTLNEDDSYPFRHPTLPKDNDKNHTETDSKEGEVPDELVAKLREALGLAEDADILKAVSDLNEEVGPLREVAKTFSEKKKFAEMFPDEAKELAEARQERIDSRAIKFAEEIGGKEIDGKGLSAKSLEAVANVHKKFSEGTASAVDFAEVMDTITGEGGLVEFNERGSARINEEDLNKTGNEHPRVAFSEKVAAIMEKDELSFDAAIVEASKRYPELASAYAAPVRA